jgi:hypothetical protein
MNIIQAVKYMMRVLIPSVTPVAGEGIMVAKEKEGSVISATFPGWVPHDMVYVANATNAAWTAGTVVALGATGVSDPEDDTLAATIPAAGADGQFAVLADDVAASSDGLAAVTGLAVAKMSAGFTEAFAAPDGLGGLAGAASGPFRVIYANSTTQTALVAFAGGGGGGGVVDNTPDIFKIKEGSGFTLNVSGGTIITGLTSVVCNDTTLSSLPSNGTRYVVLTLSYSSGAYSATISLSSSVSYPTSTSATYSITLGKVVTSGNSISSIEQWHHPAPVFVVGRWS